jgi:GTP:adenosylcobinamide-phosphate guanylyltransferase
MGIDAVVVAGDGRAARKVFKRNKALLDVGGRPMIAHIVDTLKSCGLVKDIVVVGPRDAFEEIVGGRDVILVQQKRSLAENGWEGFLHTLPEYRLRRDISCELVERNFLKPVLFLSGDIPLLCVEEIEEFLDGCDLERYDYLAGITDEENLKAFGPRKGMPGIKMATFHTRDGNFRQNNLHVARPFVLFSSIDLVLKAYEYRYQRKLGNILRALLEIVRLGPGRVGTTLMVYIDLQIAAGLSALGLERAARVVSWPLTRRSIERVVSSLIKARFRLVETTVGGAALDVDNERDYMTLSVMYRDWMNLIRQRAHQRAK